MAGKPGVAIMIGLGKHKPSSDMGGMGHSDSDHSDEEMDSQAEDDAVQAMFDAQKDGDVAAWKDAHKTFMQLCYPDLESKSSDYAEGSGDEEP